MSKDTISTLADAIAILHQALDYGKALDVVLPTKKSAENLRFRLYRAKQKERKLLAVEQGTNESMVRHPYDQLHIILKKTKEDDVNDERHSVRIIPLDLMLEELEIRDAETGERIQIQTEDWIPDAPSPVEVDDDAVDIAHEP